MILEFDSTTIQVVAVDFDKADVETSIPARFEKQVARYGDKPAIITKERAITYSDLNATANQIAHAILRDSATTSEGVALLLASGPNTAAAILAVTKAGKFWVTLDAAYPRDRLDYILAHTEAKLILTDESNLALAQEIATEQTVINIDAIPADLPTDNPTIAIAPDDLAYILYTSGSTGKPKGVIHTHRTVLHNLYGHTKMLYITAEDRLLLVAAMTHLAGITALFRALLNGGSVHPYNIKQDGLVGLADWLTEQQITLYHSVPTLFRHFVDTLEPQQRFPSVRLIHLGGESIAHSDFELYRKHFEPHCVLLSNFGSSETGTICHYFVNHETPISTNTLPVGYPTIDKEILLLDEAGQPVPDGETGQIVARSAYLSRGYWKQPDLTAKLFRPDAADSSKKLYYTGDLGRILPDGTLLHMGRADGQVKIRGNRVETTEVENALLRHPAVWQAAVVPRQQPSGESYLAAYIVPQKGQQPTRDAIRAYLTDRLPLFMVPTSYTFIAQMPLTSTSKLNRRALPLPEEDEQTSTEQYVPPRDGLEHQLVAMWQETLGRSPIGVCDNFFAVGGHSIAAMRIIARVKTELDVTLPPSIFFQAATIEKLAETIRRSDQADDAWSPLVALQAGTDDRPPLFLLPGNLGNVFTDLKYLVKYLGEAYPIYGLQDGIENPAQIVPLARYYLEEIKSVQPEGPYLLGGICAGGPVVYEMAQQLHRQGETVAMLALIEPAPPHGLGRLRSLLNFGELLLRRLLKRFTQQASTIAHLQGEDRAKYAQLKRKLLANSWALRRYRPDPYLGVIELFLAEQSLAETDNPQLRWTTLADTNIYDLPGNHDTITGNNAPIEESHMQALAQKLKQRVEGMV